MARVITVGAERVRTIPWHGVADVAQISPVPGAPAPSADFLRACLRELAAQGYRRVVTSALSADEVPGFAAAGFEIEERLCLLSHDMHHLPPRPRMARLRRGHDSDHPRVLAIDTASFTPFWRLDAESLRDTLAATPRVRFRVAETAAGDIAGYVITGRDTRRGYIQRLAVAEQQRSLGYGVALVVDALWWLRRWRVSQALVNTQPANARALGLYEALGFRQEPSGLTVMSRECA